MLPSHDRVSQRHQHWVVDHVLQLWLERLILVARQIRLLWTFGANHQGLAALLWLRLLRGQQARVVYDQVEWLVIILKTQSILPVVCPALL